MKGMGGFGLAMIRGLRQEMGGRIHEHAWRQWNLSNEGNDGNTFVRIWIFSSLQSVASMEHGIRSFGLEAGGKQPFCSIVMGQAWVHGNFGSNASKEKTSLGWARIIFILSLGLGGGE